MEQKHLISLMDWAADDIKEVLTLAHQLKAKVREGSLEQPLSGKTLALIFEKASMRTRVSFEVAATQLGGSTLYLSKSDVNLGKREPVKDGARVLSRYVDIVAARVYSHSTVEELARFSSIPVINALSDRYHPCQALADLLTIEEKFGQNRNITICYVGDANNVARSLAIIAIKLGYDYRIAAPKEYQFEQKFISSMEDIAAKTGGNFVQTDVPDEAVTGAEVLYTDTWISMGQEEEYEQRVRDLKPFALDEELCTKAAENHIVMHCLPAYRGNEITDEIIEGPHSVVFDQAENRLHAQRALIQLLMPSW
jgi:ornithine carbamoyltransferase